MCEMYFYSVKVRFFSAREILVIHSISFTFNKNKIFNSNKYGRLTEFPQMFLDGSHAGLLRKVETDPASMPLKSTIVSASIEAH